MYNISIGNFHNEEVLIVPMFEDTIAKEDNVISKKMDFLKEKNILNLSQDKIISSVIEKNDHLCYLIFLGLGNSENIDKEGIRKSFGKLGKYLKNIKSESIKIDLTSVIDNNKIDLNNMIKALTEGLMLSAYKFDKYITENYGYKNENPHIKIYLGEDVDNKDINNNIKEIVNISNIIYKVRDMINEPPNVMYPQTFENEVLKLSNLYNFDVEVLEEDDIKLLNMNAFLSVSKGSDKKAKLIIMRYRGDKSSEESLGLVGKGITYDAGGYSIKSSNSMVNMKADMGGAASVVGIMSCIALNKLKTNVTAVIPLCENVISNNSYKPGEIIKSMSGKTIEVINVDAEGRLILADAITYIIRKEKVSQIIDIATLTNAVKVTFGEKVAASITNDVDFYRELEDAMKISDEKIWRMPNYKEYRDLLKSDIADIKNYSDTNSKLITAGMFIQAFIEDKPWIHIDISGTSFIEDSMEYCTKGGTGFSVRTIYELLKNKSDENYEYIIKGGKDNEQK